MPLTRVRLLEDVGINSTYKDSRTFADVDAQTAFFVGKTPEPSSRYSKQNLTYQRKEQAITWGENAENLYNVSYLMFQNTEFGDKWFYAFITEIIYENKSTSTIKFEIDEMQTWLFDVELEFCHVERMHTDTDERYEHLVPENLDVGTIINENSLKITQLDDLIVIVATTETPSGTAFGDIYAGLYSGVQFRYYNIYDPVVGSGALDALQVFLGTMAVEGKRDAIVSVFTYPKELVDIPAGGLDGVLESQTGEVVSAIIPVNTSLDGYVPKNNKLWSFPYNYLYTTNYNGSENIYRWEFSELSSGILFDTQASIAPDPTVHLIPRDYKGLTYNYDELMSLSDYPLLAWTSSTFANWLGQNRARNTLAVAGGLGAIAIGAGTGNPLAVVGAVSNAANSIGQFVDNSIKPAQVRGKMDGSANVRSGIQNFGFYRKCVTREYAEIIDDFFDRYGYKVNRSVRPVLQTRKYWNYFKMLEVNLEGNIPNKSKEKIIEIFKQGVTFWHIDLIGAYDLLNDPL